VKSEDIAWAAGLIEGEGCFTLHSGKHPYFLLDMCDKDVLEKFQTIFPESNLRGPYRNNKKSYHKDRFRVDAFGDRAFKIMFAVYPYMCNRRQQKIRELADTCI
jgi:hypothetical protein